MQPTKEQQAAIDSTANKIIVSASAGSGKTTTMIKRIIQILQHGHCRLDQLVVLTFTEASAKDMRQKLKVALGKKVTPVELQAAQIGTFHSFCADIVRSWFTVAGVSPSFTVLDELESNKIKAEILEQVVLDNYPQTTQAVDLFAAARKLDDLYQVILRLSAFLETRENPAQWRQEVALRCYEHDLGQNVAIRELIQSFQTMAAWYRSRLIEFNSTSPLITDLLRPIELVLAAKTYTEMHHIAGYQLPHLKKDPQLNDYEAFRQLRDKFKEQFLEKINTIFATEPQTIQQDMAADQQIVEQLLTLVTKFDQAYAAKKLELKKLDFADLEKYALQVLANAEAAASIRAKFLYIFVDEGQDTNPVQFKIIDILRGDDKFFYMVGDVKQSIYGFRGCEPEMFDDMAHLVQALKFNQNFRSKDPILHYVNTKMLPLLPEYAEQHQFILAKQPNLAAIQQHVKVERAPDLLTQMELVYQQIKQSPYQWQEIAILSETVRHFPELQKYLQARGIACVIDRATNALDEPEIVVLNNFLFTVLNPTHEIKRYLTLQQIFGCSNDDLAQIRLGKKAIPAIEAVLARYQTLARSLSAGEILTMAATEFGMIDSPLVEAFLTAIRGVPAFDTVARYLYLVEHELIKIEVNVGANLPKAVKLLTIHHAKGLEFPMVILFNLGNSWQKAKRQPISLDKDLGVCVLSADVENYVKKSQVLRLGIQKRQARLTRQEKIRLLYVALTRAKEYLYLVGSWEPQQFYHLDDCLFDLLQPLDAPVRDDVVPSPVVTSPAAVTKVKPLSVVQQEAKEILVKQSVTALTKTDAEFVDYVAPSQFAAEGGKEYGTAFHQKMQYGALPPVIATLVAGYTVYKELPFLYQQGETIVQGIMDLLAVRSQEAIIVDYKTTRASEAQLVQQYRQQLALYAQALPNYQVKTYLYSTVHAKLIAVS